MFFDSMFVNESFIDLSCIICGKRWHVSRANPLAKLLLDEKD